MSVDTIHYVFPRRPSASAFDAFMEKLPYCSLDIVSFESDPESREFVDFTIREGCDREALEQKIDAFFRKMLKGYFDVSTEVLVDRRDVPVGNSTEVLPQLLERRWVLPFENGLIALQGPALALYRYLEKTFLEIAAEFDAVQMSFPTLVSIETLNKADYLSSFPHHITLAPHLIGDVDRIEQFRTNVQPGSDGPLLPSAEEPSHVLSPTVCVHCYKAIEGTTLAKGEMRRATVVGNCFRHERGRHDHKIRLWDFNMREIVFIGTTEDVGEARQRSIGLVTAWLDGLGINYWIETANDPFFIDNFSSQAFFQLAKKTKYELLVNLPETDRSLSIGSFNIHHDFFCKSFSIMLPGGEKFASTACTAFGVERCVYAFISQFGLDIAHWPEPVRAYLETQNLECL